MSDVEWFEGNSPSDLTVNQINELVEILAKQRERCDVAKAALTQENIKLNEIEQKIVFYLNELGLKHFDSAHGRVGKRVEKTWTLPKSPEDKAAYFDFLKERGDFEHLISVNSRTFNSYLKDYESDCTLKGEQFRVPGVGEPSERVTITYSKKG